MIDVSDIIRLHRLNIYGDESGHKVYGNCTFGKEDQYGSEFKLYLLHFKGCDEFTNIVNIPIQDLHIFSNVNRNHENDPSNKFFELFINNKNFYY